MPLYEGNISHITLTGIIDLIQWFSKKNIEYKFYFISKDSLVSRARNTIASKFLDDKEFGGTHLFFLDADIGFNHKNFERLLDYNKDLVCGVYPTKGINWERLKAMDNKTIKPQNLMNYNVNFIDPSNIKLNNGFAEVKEGATGFTITNEDIPIAMCGVTPLDNYYKMGRIWFLGTTELKKMPLRIFKHAKIALSFLNYLLSNGPHQFYLIQTVPQTIQGLAGFLLAMSLNLKPFLNVH